MSIIEKTNMEQIPVALTSPITLFSGAAEWRSGEGSSDDCIGMMCKLMDASFRERSYRKFSIPKKSGGAREITAPTGLLKDFQTYLADLLSQTFSIPDCANGFIRGRSVCTNAQRHVGKNYVLNMDIKDYFPSITGRMVRSALKRCGLQDRMASLIADMCTVSDTGNEDLPESVLPQGAPSSPVLSNLVCSVMDRRLEGLAKRFGLEYSRYADDITFSSYHSVYAEGSEFMTELRDIITGTGFTVNESKTRLQKRGSRQEVTGIIVNEKMNVSRRWLKNLRAAVFQIEMNGCGREEFRRVMGKIEYLGMVKGKDKLYRGLRRRALMAWNTTPMLEQHWNNVKQRAYVGLDIDLEDILPIQEEDPEVSWRDPGIGSGLMYQSVAQYFKSAALDMTGQERLGEIGFFVHDRLYFISFESGTVNIWHNIFKDEDMDDDTFMRIVNKHNTNIPISIIRDERCASCHEMTYARISLWQYCDSMDEFKAHFQQWISAIKDKADWITIELKLASDDQGNH